VNFAGKKLNTRVIKNKPSIERDTSLKSLNKRLIDNKRDRTEIITNIFWAIRNGRSIKGKKNKKTGGG
jgi:hypothetical protein